MEVVVVLPWVPAMAMESRFIRMISASISARGMTGRCFARASRHSGLSSATAEEYTTTWASPRLPAWWPMLILAPMERSLDDRVRVGDVRAGHRKAQIDEEFGDAAHADASDADEVDVAYASKHLKSPLR
jgi:hypothetical protein